MEWRKLGYPCTNESIESVVDGLNLKEDDVVISIAGSGDIPFAIAPYVRKVYAIDNSSFQVSFMRDQKRFLKKSNLKKFYRYGYFDKTGGCGVYNSDLISRKEYFEKNLERVASSLDKIEIFLDNILAFSRNFGPSEYSKVYLSNAIDHGSTFDMLLRDKPQHYFEFLEKDGLIYNSAGKPDLEVKDIFTNTGVFEIDVKKTKKARKKAVSEIEWYPSVYRKVV